MGTAETDDDHHLVFFWHDILISSHFKDLKIAVFIYITAPDLNANNNMRHPFQCACVSSCLCW